MSEMIDRLAEAIARGRSEGGRKLFTGWGSMDKYEQDMWRNATREALKALREPTVEMHEAGEGAFERDEDRSGDYRIYSADATKCWQAMIDTALA